jgi:hypothetical protein
MSEVKTNKLTAATGTAITLGDSGDTFTVPSGATLAVASGGTATGFGGAVQVVNTQTGALITGTTISPHGDTIPQNDEGNEVMTLAITPTNASNKLRIEVNIATYANSAATQLTTAALFQDSTAGAIAAAVMTEATGGYNNSFGLSHYMTAGTTSETTFKVRLGSHQSGTISFNGTNSTRQMGGVLPSGITITEIEV